jgi:stearoyl-CoA desaturase (delta-9 desaturase)
MGHSVPQAVQFGSSLLIWGVFVRTVVVWHITWSVNSLTHLWGYRNHNTSDDSRNNWFVALITFGEGWHNNHHADARSAKHGHLWFEIDLTFAFIQLLEYLGLATEVVRPGSKTNSAVTAKTDRDEF